MRYFNGNVILVTGAIRTGKTLYVVTAIKEMIEEESKKPEDKRRKFFTDIDGLKIDGVEKSPTDWRDAPHGSVIVYDECQLNPHFQADGRGVSRFDYVLQLTLAGRLGYTIIFISQSPRFLHSTIRNLANEHIHVQRLHGAEKALVCRYPKPVMNPDSKSNIQQCADKFNWDYPKSSYDSYSSLDSGAANAEHQIKFKMPAPLLKGFFFLLALLAALVYYVGSSFFGDKDVTEVFNEKKDSAVSALAPPVASVASQDSKMGAVIGAFIDKDNKCIVYDSKAITSADAPDCFSWLSNPYTQESYNTAVMARDEVIKRAQVVNTVSNDFYYSESSYADIQKNF